MPSSMSGERPDRQVRCGPSRAMLLRYAIVSEKVVGFLVSERSVRLFERALAVLAIAICSIGAFGQKR